MMLLTTGPRLTNKKIEQTKQKQYASPPLPPPPTPPQPHTHIHTLNFYAIECNKKSPGYKQKANSAKDKLRIVF